MTSFGSFRGGRGLFIFFFLSRIRAFCLEKSGVIHPTTLFLLPSFGKSGFVYSSFYGFFFCFFHLYFCWSYSTAPTAHGRRRGARGEGSREKSPLILCRRKRKEDEDGGVGGVGEEEERAVSTVPSGGQLGSPQTEY